MAQKPNPTKYPCPNCRSTNLRFHANGNTYVCVACGWRGDKKKEQDVL